MRRSARPRLHRVAAVVLCALASLAGAVASQAGATPRALARAAPRPVTSADPAQLVTAYLHGRSLPGGDVAGIRPATLRSARLPATGTDWALATFVPSSTAPSSVLAGFQDGGSSGIFTRSAGGAWTMIGTAGAPFGCGVALPGALRTLWSLPADCAAAPKLARPAARTFVSVGPQSIQQLAEQEVGVSDTPASQAFSYDCNPYTTLVAGYGTRVGCGVDPTFGVPDTNEEWCADFAKWVWVQNGVSADVNVLNPGAVSFYRWGQDLGETMPADSTTPQVGDAMVLFPGPPDTRYADHVGIVTSVNGDGTVNLVNGDFLTSSTIAVQEDDHVKPGPWAKAVEGNPAEQWVYVHPAGARAAGTAVRQAAVAQRPNGESDVVGASPSGQLSFFFNSPGSPAWYGGPIAGVYGSNPVMVQRPSGETDVVATAAQGQLAFFFNPPGSPAWYGGPIPGVYGTNPAILQRPSGETDLVTTSPSGQLSFFFNSPGSPAWPGSPIAGVYGANPVMVQRPSGETDVVATAPSGQLEEATNPAGQPTWAGVLIAGVSGSNPAVVQRPSGETDVVATAPSGLLELANNLPGQTSWSAATIAGSSGTSPVALVRTTTEGGANAGELDVVARGPHGQLEYLAEAAGTSTWRVEAVPAYGTDPVAVQRRSGGTAGETDVVVDGPNGILAFYFGGPLGGRWGGGPL